jgi:hypothetical protein
LALSPDTLRNFITVCGNCPDKAVLLELFVVPLAEHDINDAALMTQRRVPRDHHDAFAMDCGDETRPDFAHNSGQPIDNADHSLPPLNQNLGQLFKDPKVVRLTDLSP